MKLFLCFSFIICTFLSSCNAQIEKKAEEPKEIKIAKPLPVSFSLKNYLNPSKDLLNRTQEIFNTLDEKSIVAQLLMPAVGKHGQKKEKIDSCINEKIIGGILMLNGTKTKFTNWISEFEQKNKTIGSLPFLYSADAEPSLVNRKIIGTKEAKKAVEIKSIEEAKNSANLISEELLSIGINYNFAPVVDLAKNSVVGYRGFGAKKENLIPWSNAFIKETQKKNIIATAKHFPGHGLVSGDTHKSLQVINGELKELSTYPKIIKDGVLSIMVAHIAVKNNSNYNTNGLPATTSKRIVTDLLIDSLGFKGLIVTDAMNMGGVTQVKNASVKAIEAGCDIILMPVDVRKSHKEILEKYQSDTNFKAKVDRSAKKIIRMKICLGLIKAS